MLHRRSLWHCHRLTSIWEACSFCKRLKVCIWVQVMLRKRRVQFDSCNKTVCCNPQVG